jgi:hypothetical protein
MAQETSGTNLSKISSDTERLGYKGVLILNSPADNICYRTMLNKHQATGLTFLNDQFRCEPQFK